MADVYNGRGADSVLCVGCKIGIRGPGVIRRPDIIVWLEKGKNTCPPVKNGWVDTWDKSAIIINMSETNNHQPAVLITGASTGIGEACALELDRRGFRVFAGVRTQEAADRLQHMATVRECEYSPPKSTSRLTPVMIDITDAASISSAAAKIKEQTEQRGLAGLVNNAGIGVSGPLEIIPIDEIRRQFEVNVIGQIAVIQALLPLLRITKGRIVNIGSVNGAFAPPYLGPYSASKFAMEAITDALRMELRTWGISVSIVEPGPIDTPIWEKSFSAADRLAKTVSSEAMKLYEADLTALRKHVDQIARKAEPVDIVVRAVVHALTSHKPKTRYFLHFGNRFMFRGFKIVPDVIRDWLVCHFAGLP
jgi:NAD(P)-dependent dehydrogenase (short-subunit alcohol dehydrogenase family)